MNLDERIKFLVESQESLGKNIEKLYETVTQQGQRIETHEKEMERFRRALRAGLAEWLNDDDGRE
jgi:prefoldin subunit 5